MVAINPRSLRVSDLVRLLNSTPLGEVVGSHTVYRQRDRAGFMVGDGKTIDLLRYTGWLVWQRHGGEPPRTRLTKRDTLQHGPSDGPGGYVSKREYERNRQAALSASGRNIGELPDVADPDRKAKAETDFRYFCETYFPETFHLRFSDDHLKVIRKTEHAVLNGGLFAMAMPRASGKALALDTPMPTPDGWTTMGDVKVGDKLFDAFGNVCRVTFATSIQFNRPCRRVDFSDGESIVCDVDHLWTVNDRYARINPITLPTVTMEPRCNLPDSRGRIAHRYRIPLAGSLQLQNAGLPIAPYALGTWLGDGDCSRSKITFNEDDAEELEKHIETGDETVSWKDWECDSHCRAGVLTQTRSQTSFHARLRKLGLLNNKHIPQKYLRSSESQRMALLQGLMDTDGYVGKSGACEIVVKYSALADDLSELLASLGIKHGRREKYVTLDGKLLGPYQRFHFTAYRDRPVFRLERKQKRLRRRPKTDPMSRTRQITAITPVDSVPVKCIQVDSPSSLYLAGRKMVPTHNTTIAETACLWAMLYGHRRCIMLIGADLDSSMQMLDNLKMELECNDLLLADFPAATYPIRCLDGIAQRTNGQLYHGKRTYIDWTARNIVLPTIDGIPSSGCAVIARGITGKIRGFKMAHPAGGNIRPDLVVIDDPQTDESAKSLSQSHDRERVLAGAVLGLAGPDRKIAGIMPCTVIHKGDMADNILDRDKHPEWQGERTKMVYSFPDDEVLWDQYARILSEGLRNGDGTEPATQFYREHRDEMDSGAKIAWADRYNEDEISAIQHAMNLKIRDEAAFWAEYQNEPIDDEVQDDRLTADMIAEKINGRERYAVPSDCNTLTMFIDVQGKALYYAITAWTDEFTGYIVDYGTYPDQTLSYFTLRDIRTTLFDLHPGTGQEGAWYAGFDALCKLKLNREWMRDDGSALRISRCLIDANDGNASDVVYQFCRQCAWPSVVMPSRAKGVTTSMIPFSDYRRKRGDRVGHNWRIPASNGRRAIRYLLHDANYWKSFCRSRWLVAMGDPGCLSLFSWRKRSSEANAPVTAPLSADSVRHRMFAEQVTAEYSVRTEGRGRTVDEWKLLPGRDNHFLDCVTGCAVAASEQGVILPGTDSSHPVKRKRIKLSELRKKR